MDAKGRRVNLPQYGERHHMVKITDAQVAELRRRYAANHHFAYGEAKRVAQEFGTNSEHIRRLVRGKSRNRKDG